MIDTTSDIAIVGGGILGMATALELSRRLPRHRVLVLEKERALAAHQTGNNSGVIHSGIYYRPGSLKARNCVAGARALMDFCQENDVGYELCGKVIVATEERELPALHELHRRGTANGVPGLELVGPERLRELEPHTRGVQALWSPNTGIVDYRQVTEAYGRRFQENGGQVWTDAPRPSHSGDEGRARARRPGAATSRPATSSTVRGSTQTPSPECWGYAFRSASSPSAASTTS